MKILLVFASSLVAGQAYGYGMAQKIGNITYFNDSSGSYTSTKIGNFDYISGPNGYSGMGQQIGNFYYYND